MTAGCLSRSRAARGSSRSAKRADSRPDRCAVSDSIRLLLADDHTLLRETLCARLRDEADIEVLAAAGDADEALRLATEHRPDVVLLDIDMPGIISFDAAREIRHRSAGTKVVFLSAFANDRHIESALRAGAISYLTKDEPVETVIDAIRRAARGVGYFSPRIRERLTIDAGNHVTLTREGDAAGPRLASLTDRELEVLRYLARGMAKKEIAKIIHRSYSTVDKHVENLMNKLDIHDRVELARFAIREGLAQP